MTRIHIIRRQFLDVEFDGSETDACALQNRLLALCQDELGPALENVLDRFVTAEEHWIIDHLDIDAGSLQPENLTRLVKAVSQCLEERLREWAPRAGFTRRSRSAERQLAMNRAGESSPGRIEFKTQSQYLRQAFLYFLETGVLPWWFQLPAGQTLERAIRETWRQAEDSDAQPQTFARALGGRMEQASIRKRLVRQFSSGFLGTLLSAVSGDVAMAVHGIFAELRQQRAAVPTPPGFSERVWENAFVSAFAGRGGIASTLIAASLNSIPSSTRQEHPLFFERVATVWGQADVGKGIPGEKTGVRELLHAEQAMPLDTTKSGDDSATRLDLQEGLYINCAGAVLLHPFLSRFFEGLGIAAKDRLLQPEHALYLLHYLATGSRFAPEYDLLLPKVLCNLPLDAPVNSPFELTAAEEEESAALLSAVIRHWDALGNTSDENLRGSFLVRPGKLSQRDGDYLLQVETRSYDALLDRLPWGLGLVQLPWMRKILWVEWRF